MKSSKGFHLGIIEQYQVMEQVKANYQVLNLVLSVELAMRLCVLERPRGFRDG